MSQIKHTEVLFIGGPVDGQRLLVPDNRDHWKVAIKPKYVCAAKVNSDPIEAVLYKREYIYYGSDKQYPVFVATTSMKNVIESLIDGYKPSN